MLFFLLAGIWNALLAAFNFMRLFNERTFTEAADALSTYLAACIACFAIYSLLKRIKTIEENVDDLWKIAEEKGYSKPTEKNDIISGNMEK